MNGNINLIEYGEKLWNRLLGNSKFNQRKRNYYF